MFRKYSPEHSPTEKREKLSFLVYNKNVLIANTNKVATFINSSEPSCHVTRSLGRDNHCQIAASPKYLSYP